jgi:hypothetical protein
LGGSVESILRLSADGAVTKFADVPFGSGQVGMVRNAGTGNFIVSQQFPGRLLSVRPDGSAVTTLIEGSRLSYPVALLEDAHN